MKLQIKTVKSFQKQQESHLNETHQFQPQGLFEQ